MPISKSYTRAQWDAFVHALEALPEKPRGNQRVTVSDGIKEIRAQIRATQAKGCSLEEIVEEAGRQGMEVGIGAVKYALYRPKRSDAIRKSAKGDSQGGAKGLRSANAGLKPNPRLAEQARRTLSNEASGQESSGVIRGYQGFPIRPDTENL